MGSILGLDLGGTAIKSGVLSESSQFIDTRNNPTPQNDPSGIAAAEALAEIVLDYKETHKLDAVGLVIPGLVDSERGTSVFSGTLGWRNFAIVNEVEKRTSIRTYLEHDVTAAGIAELRLGASREFNDSILIQIGTGIAAAYVINKKIFKPHSQMGEFGHAPIFNDRPCPCGLNGCLEMTASGGALSRNYAALTGEKISPLEIVERAKSGERQASDLWHEFGEAMAFGIAWLASTTGPEAVILGGGIAKAGAELIEVIEKGLQHRLSIHLKPKLVISELDDKAAAIGSAFSAKDRYLAS